MLFPVTEYLADFRHRQYDVSPDDQRFIMLRPVGGDGGRELILVQNFFEELRARAGNCGRPPWMVLVTLRASMPAT